MDASGPAAALTADTAAVYLICAPHSEHRTRTARLLAAQFERGVHLTGEMFRRSIITGRIDPEAGTAAGQEQEEERLLRRVQAAAAEAYTEAGFTVVLEDLAPDPSLAELRRRIAGAHLHVVALTGKDQTPQEMVQEIRNGTAAEQPSLHVSVAVTDYDPQWPALFTELAEPIRAAVADLAPVIEHVGSTSVRGLSARPIIDIDVVLASAQDVPLAVERLRPLGYRFDGVAGIPGREAFSCPEGKPAHHLFLLVAGSRPHRDHIDFREHLRAQPQAAQQYAHLKAGCTGASEAAYAEAKGDFIAAALRTARHPIAASSPGDRATRMASLRAAVHATSAEYRDSYRDEPRPMRGGPPVPARKP